MTDTIQYNCQYDGASLKAEVYYDFRDHAVATCGEYKTTACTIERALANLWLTSNNLSSPDCKSEALWEAWDGLVVIAKGVGNSAVRVA